MTDQAEINREEGARQPILVSACLLGLRTRYDGKTKLSQKVLDYLEREGLIAIPVCPEQLAGMPTPREGAHFLKGNGEDVLEGRGEICSVSGTPMDQIFRHGAEEVLRIAQLTQCRSALLKERSPSCGVNQIYCQGILVTGTGVTTALLIKSGLSVLSEEDL